MDLTPSSSINDLRTQSLMGLLGRLDALDLAPLLVYRISSVPSSALQFLAWQFDILDPTWQLLATSVGESIDALTDIDSLDDIDTLDSVSSADGPTDWDSWRALLLQAIPLHRIRGTIGAVTSALGALGYSDVAIAEGQAGWGGVTWPADQGWAVFRVLVYLGASVGITGDQISQIIAATNFFKNERSWLDSVQIIWPVAVDQLLPAPSDLSAYLDLLLPAPTDSFGVYFAGMSDNYSFPPSYNATYQNAGFTFANQPLGPTDGASTFNGAPVEGNQ